MRMHPSGVTESQSREVSASQSVPGWSAFNTMLYPKLPENKLAWLATAP